MQFGSRRNGHLPQHLRQDTAWYCTGLCHPNRAAPGTPAHRHGSAIPDIAQATSPPVPDQVRAFALSDFLKPPQALNTGSHAIQWLPAFPAQHLAMFREVFK